MDQTADTPVRETVLQQLPTGVIKPKGETIDSKIKRDGKATNSQILAEFCRFHPDFYTLSHQHDKPMREDYMEWRRDPNLPASYGEDCKSWRKIDQSLMELEVRGLAVDLGLADDKHLNNRVNTIVKNIHERHRKAGLNLLYSQLNSCADSIPLKGGHRSICMKGSEPRFIDTPREHLNLLELKFTEEEIEDALARVSASTDKESSRSTWVSAMHDWHDDVDLIRWLQLACGQALCFHNKAHLMLILKGSGGMGKTAFLDCRKAAYMDGGRNNFIGKIRSEGLFQSGREPTPKEAVMGLQDMRFAHSDESARGLKARDDIWKGSVGSWFTGRELYGKDVEFRLQIMIISAMNFMPTFSESGTGIRRRLGVIPFTKPQGHKSKTQWDILVADREFQSDIIAWDLLGGFAWRAEFGDAETKEGEQLMPHHPTIQAEVDDVLEGSDEFGHLFKMICEEEDGQHVTAVQFSKRAMTLYPQMAQRLGIPSKTIAMGQDSTLTSESFTNKGHVKQWAFQGWQLKDLPPVKTD